MLEGSSAELSIDLDVSLVPIMAGSKIDRQNSLFRAVDFLVGRLDDQGNKLNHISSLADVMVI